MAIIDSFPYTELLKTENLSGGKPMKHQLEGVERALQRFTSHRGFAFLFEMGTGKTLTALYTWAVLYRAGLIRVGLIVCPKTALGVWKREIEKFLAIPVHVEILNSRSVVYPVSCYPNRLVIYAINYDILDFVSKSQLQYDAVIADEGHKMKSPTTKQSQRMWAIGAASRFNLLLTGTMISNSLLDIFSPYQFMDSAIYGTNSRDPLRAYYAWRRAYFQQTGYGGYTWKVKGNAVMHQLLAKMHASAMRVQKEEVLDLPDVSNEFISITLEPSVRRTYDRIVKQDVEELNNVTEKVSQNVLTRLLRLSQLCGGFLIEEEKDANGEVIQRTEKHVSTAKLDALDNLLREAFESRQKVCVFARFRSEISAIEELAKKITDPVTKKPIKYGTIHGGVSAEQRTAIENAVQNDPDTLLFIGQIKAASECITLTASNTMIFYSYDYSYVSFCQAKSRIHRNGQAHKCTYYYLVVENSVDQAVLKAISDKQQLAKFTNDDYRKMAQGQTRG